MQMNKTNSIITILLTLLLLNACSSISDGLTGSKKGGSDEFLVKQKAPLVLPPSFGELPKPGKKENGKVASIKEDISSIEMIINQSSSTNIIKQDNNSNNSIEKLIIEKINEQ